MSCSVRLRLGTRSSALAQRQARWVGEKLERLGMQIELVPILTHGDLQQGPLKTAGGTGLFTKEIQRALLDGRIDLAVHSLKDLPTQSLPELTLAAVPPRAPVGDVLVCPRYRLLEALPAGAVIGTGSLRRRAQLLRLRGDLRVEDIRGNVDTRLAKVRRGDYDATILAEAGLQRLGLEDQITQRIPLLLLLPAVGQGGLGLETRSHDSATLAAVAPLNHVPSQQAVFAERAMLAALRAGCLAPVAAFARLEDDRLVLTGRVLSPDGRRQLEVTRCDEGDPEALGRRVADVLLAQGADQLILAAREK